MLRGGALPRQRRQLLAREVFRIAFYMPHDHPELSLGVSHAMDVYMRAVGERPGAIQFVHYNHHEGSRLTEEQWRLSRGLLGNTKPWSFPEDYSETEQVQIEKRGFERGLLFTGGPDGRNGYELEYKARIPWRPAPQQTFVSVLTATLPLEYLEEHGPACVRQLALDMASPLLFASGHAGLALHLYRGLRLSDDAFRAEALRYPGIDLRAAWRHEEQVGLRVDGVHWLNFLGPPVLAQLGGAVGLRSRLHSAETTVVELDPERVVVSVGERPEAGAPTSGMTLSSYRELARVLEPWLEPLFLPRTAPVEQPRYTSLRLTELEARRWWRRFLDEVSGREG
ncbi:MAG TPA: type VI immunity family protein [Archangium sp.]|uniref:type VI immunity family protein n=1 Tax=Archangium sp. TaxID=1872627 RepID=UPI002E35354D|nr:type VI immunity family protein [Archangium sp.]HEX5750762.1 type VI immunity family protein [Archangium sp.]